MAIIASKQLFIGEIIKYRLHIAALKSYSVLHTAISQSIRRRFLNSKQEIGKTVDSRSAKPFSCLRGYDTIMPLWENSVLKESLCPFI